MNPRERYWAVLHGEVPDKVNVIAAEGLRYGPQGGWLRRLRARGMGITHIVPPYKPMFFFDHRINPEIPDIIYSKTWFSEGRVQKIRHRFETPVGTVDSIVALNPDDNLLSKSPQTHFLKGEEDWRVINYIFQRMLDELRPNYQEMLLDQEDLGDSGYTIAVVDKTPYQRLWIEIAGVEQTVMDCKYRPEGFLEFIELQTRFHKRAAEITAGCPSDQVNIIDNITNIISPRYYREFCLPIYQIYAEAFAGTNKKIAVHFDGLFGHLKNEIAESPIDIIDSFTVPPTGNVSLTEARQLWPNKIPYVNLPPHLAHAPTETIFQGYCEILAEWDSKLLTIEHVEDLPVQVLEKHLACALDVCGY